MQEGAQGLTVLRPFAVGAVRIWSGGHPVRFNSAEPIRTRSAIPPVATVVGSQRNLSHHDRDRRVGGTRRIRDNGVDEPVTRAATAILWLDHRGWESAKLPRLHGQSVDARSAFSSPQSRKRSTPQVNVLAFTAHLRSQHMPEARTVRLLKRRCAQDCASDNQTRENRDAAPRRLGVPSSPKPI